MPRPRRATLAGGIHHVINRCNHQEQLLRDADLQDLCALLVEMKRRFGMELYAYALLHNHYHLLMKESQAGSLSVGMRWFGQAAAARYNIRNKMSGHLWQGRFKSRIVQDHRDFLQCMIYIDLNPARAGLAQQVTDWPFSSTRAHVEEVADPLLDSAPVNLNGYQQILLAQWETTLQLRKALDARNRLLARSCLRQFPSRRYLPWCRELSVLIGNNFRRFAPK